MRLKHNFSVLFAALYPLYFLVFFHMFSVETVCCELSFYIKDLEVTGVSRSGRVRKKSSKLMDFESPDEIDRPYKKQSAAARKVNTITESPALLTELPPKKDNIQHSQRHALKIEEDINIEDNDPQQFDDANDSNASDYEPTISYDNRSNTISTDSLDSEQSDSADIAAGLDGVTADNGQFQKLTTDSEMADVGRSGQHLGQSHQEQTVGKNKRLVIKDGKIVSRSGKGGQQRKSVKTVPDRVRVLTTLASGIIKKTPSSATSKPFGSTSRSRGSSQQQVVSPKSPVYQLALPTIGNNTTTANIQGVSPPSPRGHNKNDHMFKVNGIKPIDVAAHLKLLGESLTIIGERLKEHEGQIAVSGSLSVLLDSLLCALGPLLCLTQQIPELQENCCDPEQLTSTLDNVAFIMPGL